MPDSNPNPSNGAESPVRISSTIQSFLGMRYYRDRNGYFQARRPHQRFLHRDVWSRDYGNIPHGWEVHHKDGNPANAEIENLVCMARRDHKAVHPPLRTYRADFVCDHCGSQYEADYQRKNRFCSPRCKSRWHYLNKKRVDHAS